MYIMKTYFFVAHVQDLAFGLILIQLVFFNVPKGNHV